MAGPGSRFDGLARVRAAIAGLHGWRRGLAAVAAGGLSVLGFAPFFATPVLFLSLPVLVWLIDGSSGSKHAAVAGWCFGFGYFFFSLFWIGEAFLVEADKFAVLLPFAVTLLPAGVALFWALASAVARRFWLPGIARVLILAVALIGAACSYKKYFALPDDRAGFPGYFAFLVLGALAPAVSFFPVARRFINWRALSLTLFFMLLVSLVWEATLAVPYNWWNFQHPQMMGLFIGAWSGLPIEEVCVWIAVTYATVIVFEVIKVLLASERSVRETLLGSREIH